MTGYFLKKIVVLVFLPLWCCGWLTGHYYNIGKIFSFLGDCWLDQEPRQTYWQTHRQMCDYKMTLMLWIRVVTVLWWSNPHSHHHVCMWVTASQANVKKWVHIWLCLFRRQCRYWDRGWEMKEIEAAREKWREWEIMSESLKCEISETHVFVAEYSLYYIYFCSLLSLWAIVKKQLKMHLFFCQHMTQ